MTIPSTSPRASASHGTLSVTPSKTGRALELDVHSPEPRALLAIVERVRRIFDLGADPLVIADQLRPDPVLRLPLSRHMGIRVPGAWDAFEIAVRAVIGQQVSVRGATTLAGRVASMFGTPIAPAGGLTMLFPTPKQLRAASIERAGIIPARAEAIRTLARLVDEGTISFNVIGDTDAVVRQLRGIGGIGDWTAQYIAMKRSVNPTPSRPAISSSEKC
jgi:AraC family transcriptional regulator of adaptative response / DNA-3-methyladenine glycosylase II